jgi:Glycosyl hydrolase family 12
MIWTYNNGQAPVGSPVGSFADAGQTYVVYRSPPPNKYIAFVALNGSLSGQVNLLDFFRYAINKGWMPASSKLYQICHGVELVSTNGKREKFGVDNFSITMKPRS